jgi:hypothetical protein
MSTNWLPQRNLDETGRNSPSECRPIGGGRCQGSGSPNDTGEWRTRRPPLPPPAAEPAAERRGIRAPDSRSTAGRHDISAAACHADLMSACVAEPRGVAPQTRDRTQIGDRTREPELTTRDHQVRSPHTSRQSHQPNRRNSVDSPVRANLALIVLPARPRQRKGAGAGASEDGPVGWGVHGRREPDSTGQASRRIQQRGGISK